MGGHRNHQTPVEGMVVVVDDGKTVSSVDETGEKVVPVVEKHLRLLDRGGRVCWRVLRREPRWQCLTVVEGVDGVECHSMCVRDGDSRVVEVGTDVVGVVDGGGSKEVVEMEMDGLGGLELLVGGVLDEMALAV